MLINPWPIMFYLYSHTLLLSILLWSKSKLKHIFMNILLCTYKILGFLQYVSLKDKYLKKKKKNHNTHLEKEMATHPCILAWRIPWTEEPGGLPSMGSQRVGHDWATNPFTFFSSIYLTLYQKEKKEKRNPKTTIPFQDFRSKVSLLMSKHPIAL